MELDKAAMSAPPVALVERIAAELDRRRQTFVDDLVAVVRLEIEGLDHGGELANWLVASIAENTQLLIDILRRGDDPREAEVPPGAVGYAVRLAGSHIPVSSLLRAYRFGQAMFTQLCLDIAAEFDAHDLRTVRRLVDDVADFIDHVCEVVAKAHADESRLVVRTPAGMRQRLVNQLLDENVTDIPSIESALDYPLRRAHLAVEIWFDDDGPAPNAGVLDDVVALIAAHLRDARFVAVPLTERDARAWFAFEASGAQSKVVSPDVPALIAALEAVGSAARLAFGTVLPDLTGFRRSHVQAVRTRTLASAIAHRTSAVTTWDDVAAVALLRDDVVELRDFVTRTLGPLAADDERARGLRETLRIFLDSNRLHDRAARRLSVHRNTVRYRVEQAVAARGKPLDADPLDLMLALSAAHWFGAQVLAP